MPIPFRAIDGYVALIEIFLPRARRLVEATSFVFPEAYARAGVAYFERTLGARITGVRRWATSNTTGQ